MSELLTRSFEIREAPDEQGVIEGRAVPYDVTIPIGGGFSERIVKGAVLKRDDIKLFYGHKEVIGRVIQSENREDGFYVRAKISDTSLGRDVLTLLRDGTLDRFSIGFAPVEESEEDGVFVRSKIDVREVSVVPIPAYDGAKILSVRDGESEADASTSIETRETLMTNENEAVEEVREAVTELERRFALLSADTDEDTTPEFRSYGEYVKAWRDGDERVLDIATREFAGTTTDDGIGRNTWIGELARELQAKQPVKNAFTTGSLPEKGLGVEYGFISEDTTKVEEQVAEGDLLAFGKLSVDVRTAGIKTFGGWSALSRQAIERTENINLLDATWRRLAKRAARAEENYTRQVVVSALSTAVTAAGSIATADALLGLVLDLNEQYNDSDFNLDGIFVSSDVFRQLAAIAEERKALNVNGGANADKLGSINVGTLTATVAGIPVSVFPGAADGTMFAYDSAAVTTLSSGGPTRLQDEDITRLTKDISVYFYASAFASEPDALTRIVLS